MKVIMTDLENKAISSVSLEIDDLSKEEIRLLITYVIESLTQFVNDRSVKEPIEPDIPLPPEPPSKRQKGPE